METMNRILPDELVAMYRATGLRPIFNHYHSDGSACGLGCYAEMRGQRFERSELFPMFTFPKCIIEEIGNDYVNGFVYSFDGGFSDEKSLTGRVQQGYLDGQACRAAVLAIDWDAPLVELPPRTLNPAPAFVAVGTCSAS